MYQSHESQIFLYVNTDIASLNSSRQNQLVIKKAVFPYFLTKFKWYLTFQSLTMVSFCLFHGPLTSFSVRPTL